jgi:hypothetical protein
LLDGGAFNSTFYVKSSMRRSAWFRPPPRG